MVRSLLNMNVLIHTEYVLLHCEFIFYRVSPKCPPPPLAFANPADVLEALQLLASARNPLVVVGKGTTKITRHVIVN